MPRKKSEETKRKDQKRAKLYNKQNIVYYKMNLNRIHDADIIVYLSKLKIPKSQYFKQLVRTDMKRYNEEEKNGKS